MSQEQPNNPLHGKTLKAILEDLVERRGWDDLAERIRVNCFLYEPSMTSSLKFLRKVGWAREKVEDLYLEDHRRLERERRRAAERAAKAAGEASPSSADGGASVPEGGGAGETKPDVQAQPEE